MGIYDRQYYNDEDAPRGISLGGDRDMVTNLVILNVGFFLLNMIFGGQGNPLAMPMPEVVEPDTVAELEQGPGLSIGETPQMRVPVRESLGHLFENMAVTGNTLTKPWLWWQLVSYGFAHASVSHIFWNMFGLWIFGRDVEVIYGRKEFLRFYLASMVLGSVIWAGRMYASADLLERSIPLVGASGAVTAVTLMFVFHYPKRTILLMFVLPVPAWFVGAMIVFVNVQGLTSESPVAYDVHLIGGAFAVAYFYFKWNLGSVLPSLPSGKLKLAKRKPRLKVHDPEEHYSNLDDEADRLLAKVNQDGMDSLNSRERKILEDYSRRMRQKHR